MGMKMGRQRQFFPRIEGPAKIIAELIERDCKTQQRFSTIDKANKARKSARRSGKDLNVLPKCPYCMGFHLKERYRKAEGSD